MKRMSMRRRPSAKKTFFFRAFVLTTAAAILLLLVDARLRPLIRAAAVTQSINIANMSINNAVIRVLKEQKISYDDLVTIDTDTGGRVTAIKTDVVKMNSLKASVGKLITESIEGINKKEIKIPLGTILGSEILSGSGPSIKVRITVTGSTNLTFENIFDTAGINQTRHQIMLKVKNSSFVFLPGNKSINEFYTNICVAETIIVGLLPNTVAQLNSNNQTPQK